METNKLTKDYLFIQGEDEETGRIIWVPKTSINYVKESGSAKDGTGNYIFRIILKKDHSDDNPIVCIVEGSLDYMNNLLKDFKV